MEDQHTSQAPPDAPVHIKHAHKFIFGYIGVIIFIAALSGVYSWQHKDVTKLSAQLLTADSQVASLKKQMPKINKKATSSNQTQTSSFIYSPTTGGLSLTLPKTYEVLVNADGNDGGAPGATFEVVPTSSTNIASDQWGSNEVTVDVSHTFTNLSQSVSAAESEINQSNSSTNFNVTDTTVAGLAAKRVTLYEDEYTGTVNAYVAGSGSWEYKITANVPSNTDTPLTDILTAVLKGLTIKPNTGL